MKERIAKLQEGKDLNAKEAHEACAWLMSAQNSVEERALFLQALHEKGETFEEIAFFADAILQMAVSFPLEKNVLTGPLLDVCGTGGDGKNFFNVSTTVMFVAAACGAKVAKHGNRSITSQCGGADVLEALGVSIHLDPKKAIECLQQAGATFLFAPDYYPVFEAIAPVRKLLAERKVRTIFNILGPLINPARPDYQLTGVFSNSLLEIYADSLLRLGRKYAWVVCGRGGEDEISITESTEVIEVGHHIHRKFNIFPEEFGFRKTEASFLVGGDAQKNAAIIQGILDGSIVDGRRDIVILNSAAALTVSRIASDLREGIELARKAIQDGRAKQVLEQIRSI